MRFELIDGKLTMENALVVCKENSSLSVTQIVEEFEKFMIENDIISIICHICENEREEGTK